MPSTPSTTIPDTQTRDVGNDGVPPGDGNDSGVQATAARVANEAPAQAARVVGDARTQLTGAAQRTLTDLRSQADDRAAQASQSLRDLSSQVDALVNGRPDEAGNLADAAKAIGQHASDFADRLDTSGLQGVADDLSRFGRQHPWAFLGLSLGAGFLVGRLTRATAAVVGDGAHGQSQLPTTGHAAVGTAQPAPAIPSTDSGMAKADLPQ
jgi:ElaB/YqjD/DUF883 family membrane-anchored ribosome-binding protein